MMPPECLRVTQDCASSPPGALVLRGGLMLKAGSCQSALLRSMLLLRGGVGTSLVHAGHTRSSPPLVFGLSLVAISEGELAPCVSNLVDLEIEF